MCLLKHRVLHKKSLNRRDILLFALEEAAKRLSKKSKLFEKESELQVSGKKETNGSTKDKNKSRTSLDKTNSKEPSATKVQYSCWLMKSEPDSRIEKGVDMKFGIEDLKKCPNQTECWDGVRNYQARNFMRDQMRVGQKVFFYHSNTKVPGIAGICRVAKDGYTDHTQFDSEDPHYDSTAKTEDPRWQMVDVKFERMMKRYISLAELKQIHQQHKVDGGPLKNIALFTKARLSVQPVTDEEWNFILSLEEKS